MSRIEVIPNEGKCKHGNKLALLPKMRRQDADTDTDAYGVGGFSTILSKMQICLYNPLQEWKNRRSQNARRLDAVQAETIGLYCVLVLKSKDIRKAKVS